MQRLEAMPQASMLSMCRNVTPLLAKRSFPQAICKCASHEGLAELMIYVQCRQFLGLHWHRHKLRWSILHLRVVLSFSAASALGWPSFIHCSTTLHALLPSRSAPTLQIATKIGLVG